MAESFETGGMILRSESHGEYDRRVVILSVDAGKITAFARGARRQSNRLMAATDLFIYADFRLFPGRNAYSMTDAAVKNYFPELRADYEAVFFGMYFLEVMEHFTRENNDERDNLKLLYQACRAITHPAYDRRLVKTVFDLKALMLQGSFHRDLYETGYSDTARYTLDFLLRTPAEKVFGFTVMDEVKGELERIAAAENRLSNEGHRYKSEEMLKTLL